MIKLTPSIQLGVTSRKVSTFGQPILIDQSGTVYQYVQPEYNKLLRRDNSFDSRNTVALDFKLPRAKGRVWPEPPSVHQELTMFAPGLENEPLCYACVSYMNLGRKRSVGLIHITDIKWVHPIISNYFSLDT